MPRWVGGGGGLCQLPERAPVVPASSGSGGGRVRSHASSLTELTLMSGRGDIAADVDSTYLVNGFRYLGKDDQPRDQLLDTYIVLRLLEPYLQCGRNVTTDNFFTSLEQSGALKRGKFIPELCEELWAVYMANRDTKPHMVSAGNEEMEKLRKKCGNCRKNKTMANCAARRIPSGRPRPVELLIAAHLISAFPPCHLINPRARHFLSPVTRRDRVAQLRRYDDDDDVHSYSLAVITHNALIITC
ncbi:hypothetical protein PR048_028768 [Dryococelus australis]|uniref:PiggyBac transposable element-derived protein domain-containing protein n=1 Tax=Dryococelus australis TaxID=614101 RepID=A0ABQ9GBG9_9NEOP|nr:hypothetical protein PR048_028768 [Dryococelus australis]